MRENTAYHIPHLSKQVECVMIQYSSRFRGISVTQDKRMFSLLLNDNVTLLNAKLNNKQITKCSYLKRMIFFI